MRIYLAARFSRRDELLVYRDRLLELGHSCDCRWLTDPGHRIEDDNLPDNRSTFNRELAFHDLQDLLASDTLIHFAPGGTRGGCHVEFGMALARAMRLYWVGDRTHVFSYLPQVEVYPNFGSLLLSLAPNGGLTP